MLRSAMLLALGTALASGCEPEAKVLDTDLSIDVSACLAQARSADCGDVVAPDRLGGTTRACLLLSAQGEQAVYAYSYAAGPGGGLVVDSAEGLLTVAEGQFLLVELLMLTPDAPGCPPPKPGQGCGDVEGCLLSFGEQQVEINASSTVDVTYGGVGGGECKVECNDDCTAETCDGKDEDCDGEVDEQVSPGEADACPDKGVCAGLTPVCEGDPGWRCPYPETHQPGAEGSCDGLDNDCDGEVDEAADLTAAATVGQPCGETAGACEAGATVCDLGAIGCHGAVAPEQEVCDGIDNDCDGTTDEDFTFDGLPIEAACTGAGECGEGLVVCTLGADAACCSTSAGCRDIGGDEVCDGLDNDCDGEVDERVTPGPQDLCLANGVCVGTVPVCRGPAGWVCDYPAGYESVRERTCDGLDNDCDGGRDDRDDLFFFDVIGQRCGEAVGACEEGTVACVAGEVSCQGATNPTVELCDGLDNDCDGAADEVEDLLGAGIIGARCGDTDAGECQFGVLSCPAGDIVCTGLTVPAIERCDGLDNDCDGATDEEFRDIGADSLGAPCGPGAEDDCGGSVICSADGGRTCCSTDEACNPAFEPGQELCDHRDNDCDGSIDEGFGIGLFCEGIGACGPGRRECDDDPNATRCDTHPGGTAYAGRPEQCNGDDDDCDGVADDGFEVGGVGIGGGCVGVGQCPDGTIECVGTDSSACSTNPGGNSYVAVPDVCDTLDNDCDGQADEGFLWQGTSVGGACNGIGECGEGVVECADAQTPTCSTNPDGSDSQVEVDDCDGVDNDCDSSIDEALLDMPCALQDGVCLGSLRLCGAEAGWLDCDVARYFAHDPAYREAVDACDGLDNDCNGAIDEPFGDLGDDCVGGIGECARGGVRQCTPDGSATQCDAQPGAPEQEVCDGDDNDCDMLTDEAEDLTPELCANQAGVCQGSAKSCGGQAGWLVCDSARFAAHSESFEEVEAACDDADNDCDGDTDEAFGTLGQACEAGQGICEAAGERVCNVDGDGTACDAVEGDPADDEACNDLDDDCDGEVDEDQPVGAACDLALCGAGTDGVFQCDDRDGDGEVDARCEPAIFIKTVEDVACYTFTRAHGATYVSDAAGTVAHAAAGVPRFAFDAGTGSTHLLIEGERKNLLGDSTAPSVPGWNLQVRGDPAPVCGRQAADGPDGGAYTDCTTPTDRDGLWTTGSDALSAGGQATWSAWVRGAAGQEVTLSLPRIDWELTDAWRRQTTTSATDGGTPGMFLLRYDQGGGEDLEGFKLWGAQVEEGAFASSFIPRDDPADTGVRPADVLTVPAGAVSPARGTWAAWFSPRYSAATADEPPTMLAADGAVTVDLDLAGGDRWRCSTSTRQATANASVSAGEWIFLACTWDEAIGVKLWVGPAQNLGPSSDLGAFAAADAPVQPLAPLPEWSLLGEARLYQRALSDAEVQAMYDETRPQYP